MCNMREELETAVHTILRAIPEEQFLKTIIEKWPERMHKCSAHEGRYFEEENEIKMEDEEEIDDDESPFVNKLLIVSRGSFTVFHSNSGRLFNDLGSSCILLKEERTKILFC